VETQCGRKPHNDFLIVKEYIHWKHQLPISPATTGRRLQPPIYRLQPEGSSNSLIFWLQLEGGYNPLSLPHPTTLKYKCRPICHYHINLSLVPVTGLIYHHCHCQPVTTTFTTTYDLVSDLVYVITYLHTFLNFNNKRITSSSTFTSVSRD
jgi:hypothetical protein